MTFDKPTFDLYQDLVSDVENEIEISIAKHGLQAFRPMGTGPAVKLLHHIVPQDHFSAHTLALAFTHEVDRKSNATGNNSVTWRDILLEEVFEALAESEPAALRHELVQVLAVAAKMVLKLDGGTV